MIVFSDSFRQKVITHRDKVKNNDEERLVYGLLDLLAKVDFDQNHKIDFYGMLGILIKKYDDINTKINQEKDEHTTEFIREISLIKYNIEKLSAQIRAIDMDSKAHISEETEEIVETYLASLVLNINRIIMNNNAELKQVEHNDVNIVHNPTIFRKAGNNSWIKKFFLTLGVISIANKAMESNVAMRTPDEKMIQMSVPAPVVKEVNIAYNDAAKIKNNYDKPITKYTLPETTKYSQDITNIVNKTNIKSKLITKQHLRILIWKESTDDPFNVNKYSGAKGLGQFLKDTWKEFGKGNYETDVFDMTKSIPAIARYLVWIEKYCSTKHPNWKNLTPTEQINIIFAAYNNGTNNLRVKNHWDINNNTETAKHVRIINEILQNQI